MGRNARATRIIGLICLGAMLVVSGCAAQGHPIAGEIDVRTLAVGNYPVSRFHYNQDAQGHGDLLEGMRMSAAVVPTVRIDPTLNVGWPVGVHTKDQMDDVVKVDGMSGVSVPVLQNRGFIVDYASGGADRTLPPSVDPTQPNLNAVSVVLLRFDTADDATLAAQELEAADFEVALQQNQRLSIDAYPNALIHWRPGVATVAVWMARKQFVVRLFVTTLSADQQELLSLAHKALDAEVPAVDAFQATPTDKLNTLQVDPGDLLARAVVAQRDPARVPDPSNFAVYNPDELIDASTDKAARQQMIDKAGVDEIGIVDTDVILRTRSTAAGLGLVADLIAYVGNSYSADTSPPQVPDAKCLHNNGSGDGKAYRCFVPYKRYLAVVNSDTAVDAQQQATAEYALLANSM
ncbi:hypothetical protein [Nocardia sp. NPDC020380]|uniref:DUF7373 family lipoprotein n=1 Tax=Nocardia sp. NPDC020380 TaxID=3364309 RepID=UPI0037B47AF8